METKDGKNLGEKFMKLFRYNDIRRYRRHTSRKSVSEEIFYKTIPYLLKEFFMKKRQHKLDWWTTVENFKLYTAQQRRNQLNQH